MLGNEPTINRDPIATDALLNAVAFGFDCANCGRHRNPGFNPIRRSSNGPFFCTFLCGWDFAGKNGDADAAGKAEKIRAIGRDA